MSDRYTERLSEYLDQELATGERSELEAHLLECAECTATLAGLKRVVARAGALAEDADARVDARVAADLWSGIAARIQSPPRAIPIGRAGGPDRRASFSMPQLLAACLVAAVL